MPPKLEKELKICILVDWFFPAEKAGGPIKSIISLLKLIKSSYFSFYIITNNFDIDGMAFNDIPPDRWLKSDNIFTYYFSKRSYTPLVLKRIIDAINPHLIYLNSMWSYRFTIVPLILKRLHLLRYRVLLSPRGMLEPGAFSIKKNKKKIFLFFAKATGLFNDIYFHATSSYEERSIRELLGEKKIFIAPNFSCVEKSFKPIYKKSGEVHFFSLTRFSKEKNILWGLEVFKRLNLPNEFLIKLDIYGNYEDEKYYLKCKKFSEGMPSNIIVSFYPHVSFKEAEEIILNGHFLFFPTLGENFGHTIAESLLLGRPVLISDRTPWNEVNIRKCGFALPLSMEKFHDAILKIVKMDNEEYQQWCQNAISFVNEIIDYEEIKNKYIKIFYEASGKSPPNYS